VRFEFEAGGSHRVVTVSAADGPAPSGALQVVVDDGQGRQSFLVEARATAAGVSWIYLEDRRSVDAIVLRQPDGSSLVDLPRASVVVRQGRTARPAGPRSPSAEQRITAPLPGRVVKVLVTVGAEVAARQDLVVIEAMKMENVLQAAHAGRVREVHVVAGASVDAGRLLIIIAAVE
jgi:biotin carboxyl carrier protein